MPSKKAALLAMDLTTAKAVVAAHMEAEYAAKRKEAEANVGKFYKYRNSYGSGEKWWMYFAATGADDGGTTTGWSFQRTSSDEMQMDLTHRNHLSGWTEIPRSEFNRAARSFASRVAQQFVGRGA